MNDMRTRKLVKRAKNKAHAKKLGKNKVQMIHQSVPYTAQNNLINEAPTRKRLNVSFDRVRPFSNEWRAQVTNHVANEFFNECVERIGNNNPGENMEILSSSKMCTMTELHIFVRTLCPRGFVINIRHIIYQRIGDEEMATPIHQCVLWQSGQDIPVKSNEFHFMLPVDHVVELYDLLGSVSPELTNGNITLAG